MFFVGVAAPGGEESDKNARLDKALRKLAKGHTEAMEELYELTKTAVYGYIFSILKNAQDAEDILQDTYVKVCMNADQYTARGKPMAWILTIARNLSLMRIRSQKRMTDIPDYEWEAIADGNGNFGTEDRMVLQAALTQLSEEESRIVMLHAVSGLKHREIADMMDMPLATVLSKYNRAIKKLQKYI
ncbi:MAG: RNA polymerase sigma factor [Lachnospiraceae bacterium]|nr:RNA polymerase sigma factor [Lachnospiraceae bacterium]